VICSPEGRQRWNALVEEIEAQPELAAEVSAIANEEGYEHLANDVDGLVEEWAARQAEILDPR